MLEGVQRFVDLHGLVVPGSKVLVAVSGGPDSMCLLDVLWKLSQIQGFDLHVSYVDHQTRSGTRLEGLHVQKQASCRRIPFTCLSGSPDSRKRGGGPEQIARQMRYGLLTREARRIGAPRIAVGHTLDDQAETVLLRMMRGTGLVGLGGMKPLRDDLIIRPLLEQSRSGVHDYLEEGSIPYLVDPTNAEPRFLRNRIRTEILPLLEQMEPGIAHKLGDVAEHARAGWDALAPHVRHHIESTGRPHLEGWILDAAALRALDAAMQPLVVRGIVARVLGDTRGLYAAHIRSVLGLACTSNGSASVDLPRGLRVVRGYDEIEFTLARPPVDERHDVTVDGPGSYGFGPWRIRVDATSGENEPPFPLSLRSRRMGDRLAGRRRKLKKLFIDRKVPRHMRDSVPVLAAGDQVFWVGGLYRTEGSGLDVSLHAEAGSRLQEWLCRQSGDV